MIIPETVELCVRDRDNWPCLGVVFHPQAGQNYCVKCGGKAPGQIFVRQDVAQLATIEAATVAVAKEHDEHIATSVKAAGRIKDLEEMLRDARNEARRLSSRRPAVGSRRGRTPTRRPKAKRR